MVALAGSSGPVSAFDSMRCGNKLVLIGDPVDKLLTVCGPPTSVDEWEEERVYHFKTPPPPDRYRTFEQYGKGYRVRKFVKVELWTYNNVPSRFIEYVRIENGKILKIENGGYGY
jgi:hypothetical protein